MFKELSGSVGSDCIPRHTSENQDVGVPAWGGMEKSKQHARLPNSSITAKPFAELVAVYEGVLYFVQSR
jgi:hypothetical protein